MSDHDHDDTIIDGLREDEHDLDDVEDQELNEQGDSMFERISDAVEDVIPGDSDHDGH